MRSIYVVCVCLFLMACNIKTKKENKNVDTIRHAETPAVINTNIVEHTITPVKINTGYIAYDSIKINGVIKFKDSFKHVVFYLGKPESNSYYDKNFKYCYFNGLLFEKYKDTLVLRSIEFKSSKIYITYPKLRLSNQITLKELNKRLPYAILDTLGGTDMDERIVVRANVGKENTEDKWILYFDYKTEKLYRMNYWIDD